MGIKVYWDNFDHSAVQFEISGSWTWRSFGKQMQLAFSLIQSVPHRVDIIVNALGSKGAPESLMEHINSVIPYLPNNTGTIMMVGKTRKACDVFASMHKIYSRAGFDVLLVGTVEQARKGLILRRRYAAAS